MGIPNHQRDHVMAVQSLLRERLCGRRLPPVIHGLDKERAQLFELIRRTGALGESNSILVVGARGSGKSMLMRSVLEELKTMPDVSENLLQVHLNGLMQTSDRLALREITLQLQLENAVGDRVFGSFAETLQFLLDALKSGGRQSKSILFVLEEFDLFTHHKNQTLLYNLFDVSQSAQAPVCVVGLTARLDVMELLEKRVKSRFSHRQLHLLPTLTWDDYLQLFQQFLQLPDHQPDRKFSAEWNKHVSVVAQDGLVQDVLRRQFNLTRDLRALHTLMLLPVCKTSADRPYLRVEDFLDSSKLHTTDSKAALMHGISVLELCLIIAMKHLTETYDGEPFNFEMIYKEYSKFCQKKSSLQLFDKAVVLKAFEHLCALELVQPLAGTSAKTQKEFRLLALLVDSAQIMDALQKYPNCPTEVKQWASSALAANY